MSLRPIHLLGAPVLRQRAVEIGQVDDEIRAFAADLFETMRAYRGVGLAANQVGVARRIAVVETDEAHSYVLIDPVVITETGSGKDEEGCLSIPDIYGDVRRAEAVVVEATDLVGQRRRIEGTGLLARAMLHEIDHLDGILFLDRVGPIRRRLLIREWERSRRGKTGYIRGPATAEDAAGTG